MKSEDYEVTDKRGNVVAIPAISAFFYFGAKVHAIATQLATGIERYIEYVGFDVLNHYIARSGYWKPMTKRQLNKDLKLLRAFPDDHVGANIDYDAAVDGVPGPFGVFVRATDLSAPYEANGANLLRLDFPHNWLRDHSVDEFLEHVIGIAMLDHVETANVGYAFKRAGGSAQNATRGVNARIRRYFGFDPCYKDIREEMSGRTLGAHWLNYLDNKLIELLGGEETVSAKLPSCEIRPLSNGVMIRGAKLPPVGDINHRAPDLGCLPDVARLLAPTRVEISGFGEPAEVFDPAPWLARMDELESRRWDNTDAG